MYMQSFQSARSLTGLAVLGLLAVAFVAGQASANLPAQDPAASISMDESAHLILDLSSLSQPESRSRLLDMVLELPTRAEINLDRLAESRSAPSGADTGL